MLLFGCAACLVACAACLDDSACRPGLAASRGACSGPPGAPERLYAKRWCGAQENVNRLKAYKASLVVFPRRSKKPKAGDTASKEEREGVPQVTGRLQPLVRAARTAELETAEITEEMQVRPGALCEKC